MRFVKRHAILLSVLLALVILAGIPLTFYLVKSLNARLFEAIVYSLMAALLIAGAGAGYNTWRVLRRRRKRNWTWIPSIIFGVLCVIGFVVVLTQYLAIL